MNFLKFLKKKQANGLETLLKKAANSPADRFEFISRILSEKLFVITNNEILTTGYTILEKDTKIDLFSFEDGRVPVFTSTDRIFDKKIIKEQVTFLELNGKDLFGMLKGKTVILNPYSDYGKEFHPEEIEKLRIEIKKETQIIIGQPSRYPREAVNSLSAFFSGKPDVISAYVGWMHDPASDDPPHYIFAFDISKNYDDLSKEAGFIVNEILGGEIFDVIRISGRGGIEDYFVNSSKPFYIKTS